MISRTQFLLLGFFACTTLLVIVLVDPANDDDAMKLPVGRPPLADLAILGGISSLIILLPVGTLRP